MLNYNEKRVLSMIKKNPYITQKEIGEALDLNRSTVATIISSLSGKNEILGRAYILKDETSSVFCIGGINVDRKYILENELILGTSNPAHSQAFVGGVARNIAENLGRLGHKPQMISVGGYDQDFEFIKNQSRDYINFQHVKQIPNYSTGSYSAVLSDDGEMQFAMAVMEILDEMDIKFISSYQSVLENAKLIAIDLNLPYETVEYLITFCRERDIDLVIIPVSSPKMKNLPKNLEGVQWVIVNQDESEAFFETKVNSDEDFEALVNKWLNAGVKQVVITRGGKYSVYGNKEGKRLRFSPPRTDEVVDVTGAGDSYSSGIIHGHLMDCSPEETLEFAMTNAYYTIQTESSVREDLTVNKLNQQRKNLKEKGLFKWD